MQAIHAGCSAPHCGLPLQAWLEHTGGTERTHAVALTASEAASTRATYLLDLSIASTEYYSYVQQLYVHGRCSRRIGSS